MPGPKKAHVQRVKGNLKPSSSSQAAQLLAAAGQAPVGFIGFSTQPAFVPASETFDDVDNSLDADFRLVLRKLSKKDTVTKIKALQELVSLCGDKNDDDIKAIIPFWPRLYNKVALDVDHKVRELSQKAMMALANRAGKNMAPHLKSVMGCWIVSMCDTYPTVATAANSAFTGTFPAAKQKDVFRFCKEDIADCLMNNILKHTAHTLSDPTTTSEEDMIAKYNRVVSSSLQAFQKLCTVLPPEAVSTSISAHFTSLLSESAFWKHTKSAVATVQGGLLSILSCICQYCPKVSGQFVKKISPFVFSCIDTSDPVIVSHVWEALLSLINAHEDCWEHVNWQKAVWPKLKRLLEGGCFGLATIIAPCLLPLLSKLPHHNFSPFFDAMRIGLTKDCLVSSLSEMSTFVQAFVECVHYSIKHILSGSDSSKISNLLQDQVLVVVEASLTEEKACLSKSPLYALLTPLISFIGNAYPEIEECFWKDLSTFICTQLMTYQHNLRADTETEKNERCQKILLQRLVLLIQGIVFHEVTSPGKKVAVRFAQHAIKQHSHHSSTRKKQPMSQASESLITDLLVIAFYMTDECASSQYLSLFRDISTIHIPTSAGTRLVCDSDTVKCRLSENFTQKTESKPDPSLESKLTHLMEDCKEHKLQDGLQQHRDFLFMRLLRLLLYHQKEDVLDLKYTEQLLMCIFSFLTYLPEDDGSKILSAVLQVLSTHLITCQFIEQLLQQANQIVACRNAVENLEIRSKIADLASKVTEKLISAEDVRETVKETAPVWRMLSSVVLYLNEEPGDRFSPSCVDSIMHCSVSSMKWLLRVSSTPQGSQSVPILLSLVQSLLDRADIVRHQVFVDLVLSLLSLTLTSSVLCSEAVDELESVWCLCLQLITSQPTCTSHMTQVCSFIRDWVCSHLHTVDDLEKVSRVVQLMSSNMRADNEKSSYDEGDRLNQFEQTEDAEEGAAPQSSCKRAVMDVIVSGPLWVDEMEQVAKHLYIEECLSPPESCLRLSGAVHIPSIKSYALAAVHNLRTISTSRKKEKGQGQDKQAHHMTSKDLQCLATLAENVLVIGTSQKTHQGALSDISQVIEELRSGVADLLASLTHQQLSSFVDICLKRSPSALARVGMEKLLQELLQSRPTDLHSKRGTSDALRMSKTSFLQRFISPTCSADEVISLLKDKAELTGSDLSEAFTLTCSLLISSDTSDLSQISGCLTGFMSLLTDFQELSHELKTVVFNQTLAMVKHLKEKGIHLLTGGDVHLAEDVDQVHFNVCVARLTNMVVLYQNHEYWEFTLCTLVEWLQFLSETKISDSLDKSLQALVVAVCQMTHSAASTFSKATVVTQATPDTPSFAVTEKMKTEWDEFFAEGIFSSLLPLYISLASQSITWRHSDTLMLVLKSLASATSLCPPPIASDHQLPARLSLTDSSSLPDNLKTLLNHLCPLLNSKDRHVGVAAYNILSCVIDSIPQYENKTDCANKESEAEEEARAPPEALVLVVESNAIYLDGLMTVDIETEVEVEQGTVEHAQAMGYLLAWRLLLQLFKCSPNELRAKYAQFFKQQESVSHLLDHLIRLMPTNPPSSLLEFSTSLDAADDSKPHELFAMALNVYHQCLEVIPALVRTWWVEQNRKTANFVDRFTTDHMSNSLCCNQLASIQTTDNDIEDITIRVRTATREVCAVYQMAEVTVNMTITLPTNYPLGKVDVVCDKRVGVSQAQWDRWLLQLNIFLQQQNGSIVEGLKVWKGNIDKKFEGIDDCMICFSVIHGTTFQLPRLTCRTCRKKFHSSCLYKWFHTSQKSSCPLCRNLF